MARAITANQRVSIRGSIADQIFYHFIQCRPILRKYTARKRWSNCRGNGQRSARSI